MDSVTQLVLGASVGHAVAGKAAGRKAILAGAIGGTIPDLDVVFYPLLDSIQRIGFHRGISHSFLFVIVASPVFGWIAARLSSDSSVPRSVWMRIGFWSLLTHILLDSFTVYGTGLFEPFSNYRAAFNSIFIIDPLYTLPLVIGLLPAVFGIRSEASARIFNICGLALSTLYLGWTLVAKFGADRVFESNLARSNIEYTRMITTPTAFNSVLWRALVETDDGFVESYYSLVTGERQDFRPVRGHADVPSGLEGTPAVSTVQWFSNGLYTVSRKDGSVLMNDLRFGTIGFYEGPFVFTFEILSTDAGPGTAIRLLPTSFDGIGSTVREVWLTIRGRT